MRLRMEVQTIADRYLALSDGERSCVLAMLGTRDGVQLTTQDSKLSQFYTELARLSWAEQRMLDPELSKVETLVKWAFTETGLRKMPAFLLALETLQRRDDLLKGNALNIARFIAMLLLAYVVLSGTIYLMMQAVADYANQAGDYKSIIKIAVVLSSFILALEAAVRLSILSKDRVQRLSYLEFISMKTREIALTFTGSLLLLHSAIEWYLVHVALRTEPNGPIAYAIQLVTLGVALHWICKTHLPRVCHEQHNSQFRRE